MNMQITRTQGTSGSYNPSYQQYGQGRGGPQNFQRGGGPGGQYRGGQQYAQRGGGNYGGGGGGGVMVVEVGVAVQQLMAAEDAAGW